MYRRFDAFFGVDCSFTRSALEIDWPDVDKILTNIKRDVCRCASYIVTDKELYQRTVTIPTPIEERK